MVIRFLLVVVSLTLGVVFAFLIFFDVFFFGHWFFSSSILVFSAKRFLSVVLWVRHVKTESRKVVVPQHQSYSVIHLDKT